MSSKSDLENLRLPKYWPRVVKSAVLHVISIAQYVMAYTQSCCANSPITRVRLKGQLEQAKQEIALLREEIRIKDSRMQRISAHKRPHYSPTERMAILEVKAARNLNASQVAERFHVKPATISNWLNRLDEQGPDALVKTIEPVNKYPDFIRYIVQRLGVLIPAFGKIRKTQLLARCGLHLCGSTIHRMGRDEQPAFPDEMECVIEESSEAPKVVSARYPDHVWQVDLTTIPTSNGFWTSWFPHNLVPLYPFCYWLAFVIDHFTRRVVGFAVYKKEPTSLQIRRFLGRAMAKTKKTPRHIICDRGRQFDCNDFRNWCERKIGRLPRYGAVGKHGSIALIERFIRSAKDEYLRKIIIPFNMKSFRRQLTRYVNWYNTYRPHQGLDGATPLEILFDKTPANHMPRYEPREKWPEFSKCASPQAPLKERPGTKLKLCISYYQGDRLLPIVDLQNVA